MRRGRHAADDGSFGRSTSTALGRGLLLLGAAVILGVVLLARVDSPADEEQVEVGSGTEEATTTTVPRSTTTTAPMRAPKDVKVLTANGTDVKGVGGRVKDKLLAAGYNALQATDTTTKPQNSAVYYAAGLQREAAAVAQLLSIAPSAVLAMPATAPVADLKGAEVLVVVGPDVAAQHALASTTTTTAKPASTTTTTR